MAPRKRILPLVLLIILAAGATCAAGEEPPRASSGVLDLRQWDFSSRGAIPLDGEWAFHWRRLGVTTADAASPAYLKVPSTWSGYGLNGRKLPGVGFGTMRLRILLNENAPSMLAVRTVEIRSAFEMRVHERPLIRVGRVSDKRETAQPRWHAAMGIFPVKGRTLDLEVRVANFHHRTGGIRKSIVLGTPDTIRDLRETALNRAFFLSGTLSIIGLVYLAFFLLRRKDHAPLYFCVVCLLIALRTLLVDDRYPRYALQAIPWEIFMKAEYLTFYLAIPAFAAFTRSIFPDSFARRALTTTMLITGPCVVVVLALPALYYYYTLPVMQGGMLLLSLYLLYILFREARRGKRSAILFLCGFSVLIVTAANDILHANGIIRTGNFSAAGLLFFIFSQSLILAARLSGALNTAEELTGRLEEKVARRTEQLNAEKETSERLLLNILPEAVADELKEHGRAEPRFYDQVTILFADLKGFTAAAARMPPRELVDELNRIFLEFDHICDRRGVEKLKTIGDAYMCAGGIPGPNRTHALDVCLAALEMRAFMEREKENRGANSGKGKPSWEIRIGIHMGPVMAGVIGKNKFAYDLWGDTVNTASRCESSGEPGRINISAAVNRVIKPFFDSQYRGKVVAKGKGKLDMYFLEDIKARFRDDAGAPNEKFHAKYRELETSG